MASNQTSNFRIGDNLKKLRARKGYCLDDVPRFADLSLNTVICIESGLNKNRAIDTLNKLATALGVSVCDLLQ